MRAVLARAEQQRVPNVRLVQGGYHTRSLSLYTKLGFTVRETLATLAGEPLDLKSMAESSGRRPRPTLPHATPCACRCTGMPEAVNCANQSPKARRTLLKTTAGSQNTARE
jgi:hypothetical protein